MRRWARCAWWGLAGLGALVLLGGLWTQLEGRVAGTGLRSSPRLAAAGRSSGPETPSAVDAASEIDLVGGQSLQSALAVSFLDVDEQLAPAAPASVSRPLLVPGEAVRLARAGARLRTVSEAPGLVLLALAALAAAHRRRVGGGGPLPGRPS